MKFLAAAVQMVASDDKAANLNEAGQWIRQAAAQGARLVALPEVFIWRGEKKREREFVALPVEEVQKHRVKFAFRFSTVEQGCARA